MRSISNTLFFLVCITINISLFADVLAQPRGGGGGRGGGGRGGGGGQGGGPRGLGDLRGDTRQSPFADLPWDAQKLLESNRPTFQSLPRPLQGFIFSRVKDWDTMFPIRKEQFEIFFKKAEKADRQELINAFRDAMPLGFRNRGQRQAPPDRPRRGQRQRGGPMGAADLSATETTRLDKAFQKFVLPDQDTTPGLILVLLTGENTLNTWPDTLKNQGTVLTNINLPEQTTDALVVLQTGNTSDTKRKNLAVPSLSEYINQTLNDKTHHRTLAFFQTPNPPPITSKTKGYGKKYGPLNLKPAKLSDTAKTIDQTLSKAIQQGKSDRYIELMVKPKLTPQHLKLKKQIKEPALQHVTLKTLLDHQLSRQLGPAFIQTLTTMAIKNGLPDLLICQFNKDTNTPTFLTDLYHLLVTHPRYENQGTLAIIDHPRKQALLLGAKINAANTITQTHQLHDITATLAKLLHLQTPHIAGQPISGIATTF